MAKERLMAIIIGVVMVMSAAGFALNSAVNQNRNTTPGFNIPTIVDRQLTTQEIVYVLQNGKVVIEFLQADNCTDCSDKIPALEGFAQKMNEFVVLEEVKANETSIQIIGAGGKIENIGNMTLSEQNLMTTFCGVAIAQPPECLMPE
jgi:thiol-disulfide isomerase/thioredoxin